jgi:hypothetical protein
MPPQYRKDVWFSPTKIIVRYVEEEQKLGVKIKEAQYKVYREARAVALMLLGMEKMQNRKYWLQLVDPAERTPDIRTATHMVETDRRLVYQDVEVVTLESHSKEDVDDFLKRTKLSAKKAYQEDTIILCHIDKDTATKKWSEISAALVGAGKKYDIYLLARSDPKGAKYQFARIYPKFDQIVIFDAVEEANKRQPPHNARFERSTIPRDRHENTNYEPFS